MLKPAADWQPAPRAMADALTERLRAEPGARLRDRTATVLFDAGDEGAWTVQLHRGRPLRWERGAVGTPTTTIRGDLGTLTGLVDGSVSGAHAFTAGHVALRGDMGLALALDGAFLSGSRATGSPRATIVEPRVDGALLPTATLVSGPPDAPHVVLLHGLGATASSLMPLVLDLARDHRVWAPDLPGHGDTAKPSTVYDAAFLARWLSAFLDVIDARNPVLGGNSLGGRLTLEAAMREPGRHAGLLLLCPAAAFRRIRQAVPLVRVLRPGLARAPIPAPPHRLVIEGIRAMFSKPDRLPQTWYDAGADEFTRVWHQAGARHAFFSALRSIYLDPAFGGRGFWDRLPSLTVPDLFLWGERDRLVPAGFARHVREALPAASSQVLEDCGHVPQLELPLLTSSLVRGFLADVVY